MNFSKQNFGNREYDDMDMDNLLLNQAQTSSLSLTKGKGEPIQNNNFQNNNQQNQNQYNQMNQGNSFGRSGGMGQNLHDDPRRNSSMPHGREGIQHQGSSDLSQYANTAHQYHQSTSNQFQQQPSYNLSNTGGSNNFQTINRNQNIGGGSNNNPQNILQQMAKKIQDTAPQIRFLNEFFIPYDSYESRIFEAWELEMIFSNYVNQHEIESFVTSQQSGYYNKTSQTGVPCAQLISQLGQFIKHLEPGKMGFQSVFSSKVYQQSEKVKNYLNIVINFLQQNRLDFVKGYERYFNQSYINEEEFAFFLQQIQINLAQYDMDFKNLFSYFKIQNESMISKIGFVQGLKSLNQTGSQTQPQYDPRNSQGFQNSGMNSQLSMGSMQQQYQSDSFTRFISEIQTVLQRGLSFEGFLNNYGIPNMPYLQPNAISDICQRIGLQLTYQQQQEIIQALDEDHCGKAKLSFLRYKVEHNMSGSAGFNQSQTQSFNKQATNSVGFNQSQSQNFNKQVTSSSNTFSPRAAQNLDKIKNFLRNQNIYDLRKIFQENFMYNKVVVELQQFLIFLQSPEIGLNQKDSFEIACKYILDSDQSNEKTLFVDLESFEEDVYDQNQQQQNLGYSPSTQQIKMQDVYNEIRKYIMSTSGNIYQAFKKFDINQDNLIQPQELKMLLQAIGFNASEQDLKSIIHYFDINKDGKISISELCQQFSDVSNQTSLIDPGHWAFYIFENIRRTMMTNNMSLSQLFGINQFQIQTLQDKIFISKDQFFSTMEKLNIPIKRESQQALLSLLGATQQNNFDINFIQLQQLIGMPQNGQMDTQINQYTQDWVKNPYEQNFVQNNKKFNRQLFDVMQSKNIQIKYLRMMLQINDQQKSGLITLKDFQDKLQSIDFNRTIDFSKINEVLKRYIKQQGMNQMIDYNYFLGNLEIEQTKYKLINSIFMYLDQAIHSFPQVQNLAQLFLKFDNSGQTNFTKQMLQSTLQKIGMSLSNQDIDLILIEYDESKGNIQQLDFQSFNADFEEFKNGKSNLNSFVVNRETSYTDFYSKTKEYNINLDDILQKRRVFVNKGGNTSDKQANFKNMKQGNSNLGFGKNNQYGDNNNNTYQQQTGPTYKEPSLQLLTLLTKIGFEIETNHSIKIQIILQENDISNNGLINKQNLSKILEYYFKLNSMEQQLVVEHFGAQGSRNEIIIYDFLESVSQYVQDQMLKTALAISIQEFKTKYTGTKIGGKVQLDNLAKYTIQMEEILKAIISRGLDTYKYFQNLSHNQQTISKQEFTNGLINLNLKTVTINDINELFSTLDSQRQGSIEIFTIDSAVRSIVTKSGLELSNDILEQIVKGFNGDDAFILQQLAGIDKFKTGKINQTQFVTYFLKNAPQYTSFSENDLNFIAQNYINQRFSKIDVDYNSFHSDLVRIKKLIGLQGGQGSYQGIQNMMDNQNQYNQDNKNQRGGQPQYNSQGQNFNPLSPNYSKNNTRQGNIQGSKAPLGFKINIQAKFMEDLIKATFMKGKLVEDYFLQFVPQQMQSQNKDQQTINEGLFGKAVADLQLDWNLNQCQHIFNEIDRAFNQKFTKMAITPSQIDQAVHFTSQKTVEDLFSEILQLIAQHASSTGLNLRGEIQHYDQSKQKLISVDSLKEIVLNRMLIRDLNQKDVIFLSLKYIQSVPNMIHYEKLLDDIESIFKTKYSHFGDFKLICDYILKACIVNQIMNIQQYLQKFMQKNKEMLTGQEFEKALSQLGIIPSVCSTQQVATLFAGIDISHFGSVTIPQIQNYINKITQSKSAKEYQQDILQGIYTTAKSRNIIIDNIFKSDDSSGKGVISLNIFENKLTQLFQQKDIDVKILDQKYIDPKTNQINYRNFLIDLKSLEKGFELQNTNSQMNQKQQITVPDQKLKELLIKIGQQVLTKNVQLGKEFQVFEKGTSINTIPATDFYLIIKNTTGIVFMASDQKSFSDFYGTNEPSNYSQAGTSQIMHRRFLEDLKLYGSNRKPIEALTLDQRNLYQALGDYIKKNSLQQALASSLFQRDTKSKGYLQRYLIEEAFQEAKFTIKKPQFDILLGVLDSTLSQQMSEFNYKQLLEYLIGSDEATKFFTQASKAKRPGVGQEEEKDEMSYKFLMPNQPINPLNSIMGEIGLKIIKSNINIEDEFKRKVGNYQSASMNLVKVSDKDIIDVLKNCNITLNQDEYIHLNALIIQKKDTSGLILLIDFLQAIGLPVQTLSLSKLLPKRILNPTELKQAQDIIKNLRNQLQLVQKKPQDVFEKYKQKSLNKASLNALQFRLAIQGEFSTYGKNTTDQNLELLTYYLQEEEPGEISYKKLYLAFTLLDKDPPLKQFGTEEIKKYEEKIKRQFTSGMVPLEIIDLIHFLNQQKIGIQTVFKTDKGQITKQDFENGLRSIGFVSKNMQTLVDALSSTTNKNAVSIDKLVQFSQKMHQSTSSQKTQVTASMARDMYTKFDPKVRQQLQKISDHCKNTGITLQRLYQEMDINQDGVVDKKEFVTRISTLGIQGVFPSDLGLIYDQIDMNNDGVLSISEFGLFLEGAKASRMQRLQELDSKIISEMEREVETLFKSFDENGDGVVTADEIYKSMLAMGNKQLTLNDAKEMIAQIDSDGDGKLQMREFKELMIPKMKEELLKQEDNVEDLRALFLEADIDHSGTLTLDEVYSVILTMGAEVTMEELIEMMNEIDVDRNGALDIDEFIALMSMGEEIQFRSSAAKNTYLSIRKVRKLNPMDFLRQFKNMPMNFVPSFYFEKWVKNRKNLPSSVFMPQLDPKTMLYKDIMPIQSENIPPSQNLKAFQPRLRPIKTAVGSQILLDLAEGVPIPKSGSGFERNQIVKRAVRIGLFDQLKKDFIMNAVQVNGLYNANDEDMWKFNEWKENGLNPVLFKTASKEEYCKGSIYLIFELVIYVKFGEKVTEMSCGWCQLNTNMLERQMTHKLQIKGGSPNAELLIKSEDVHTKRTGMNYIMKAISNKVSSQLTVSIRPFLKFTEETRFHMDLLPHTCLIQKRLLYFVSGFRNYIGEKLLRDSVSGIFRQPEGDVTISTFPKILDNPDICEILLRVYSEDFWASIGNQKSKLNIEVIMAKTKEYIQKLYPVLYSDEFGYKESNPVESACGDQQWLRKREELILSALRFGQTNAKVKVTKPLESLTTFKPFTVRELEYEVWDTSKAKQEKFLKQYDDLGLLANKSSSEINTNTGVGGNFNQKQISGNVVNNNTNQMQQQQQQQQHQQQQQQQNQQPRNLLGALNNTQWN